MPVPVFSAFPILNCETRPPLVVVALAARRRLKGAAQIQLIYITLFTHIHIYTLAHTITNTRIYTRCDARRCFPQMEKGRGRTSSVRSRSPFIAIGVRENQYMRVIMCSPSSCAEILTTSSSATVGGAPPPKLLLHLPPSVSSFILQRVVRSYELLPRCYGAGRLICFPFGNRDDLRANTNQRLVRISLAGLPFWKAPVYRKRESVDVAERCRCVISMALCSSDVQCMRCSVGVCAVCGRRCRQIMSIYEKLQLNEFVKKNFTI